ncbi:MAG: MotA/TolQ/ExbB proton channel family protein [Bacteroidales bacterium]|nr:MotA/TolQ/ExbB proton channel family protein [Bacteroidales bacterium]
MKKFIALFTLLSFLSFGIFAQETVVPAEGQEETVVADSAAVVQEDAVAEDAAAEEGPIGGIYKSLKIKFIEGSAGFMSCVALALVLGLAFCIERILYLNMSSVDVKVLLAKIEKALLEEKDVEKAMNICKNTRGPVASIFYQGISRLDQGVEVAEKSIISYGGVQTGLMERNFPWISLFIAISPSLGFLGTVIGMIQAFDKIQQVGDISPTVVAGGMKVALITTVFGLISAMILQIFFNYILSKVDSIVGDMEDSSISLLDIFAKMDIAQNK